MFCCIVFYVCFLLSAHTFVVFRLKIALPYLGGGLGAGVFFPPELYVLWCCVLLLGMSDETGALTREDDFGIGPVVIFPEIFLTGWAITGVIRFTFTFLSPLRNLGSRFKGTFVKGQLMPSILGN